MGQLWNCFVDDQRMFCEQLWKQCKTARASLPKFASLLCEPLLDFIGATEAQFGLVFGFLFATFLSFSFSFNFGFGASFTLFFLSPFLLSFANFRLLFFSSANSLLRRAELSQQRRDFLPQQASKRVKVRAEVQPERVS